MITLENISALSLLEKCQDEKIQKILIENQILTYQDLKDLSEENTKIRQMFSETISRIEEFIDKSNEKGKEPQIYTESIYPSNNSLEVTDMYTKGRDLLLWNPTTEKYIKCFSIRDISIVEIKHLLSHCDVYGKNLLTRLMGIGDINIIEILSAISMYEEQVIRQSYETKARNINLFTLNQEVKKEIVMASLRDIVDYLFDNTKEELIWGKLTEPQKRLLLSATLNNNKTDNIIRNHLVDIIANYTTLSELEEGITKTKTLNRFIKK